MIGIWHTNHAPERTCHMCRTRSTAVSTQWRGFWYCDECWRQINGWPR